MIMARAWWPRPGSAADDGILVRDANRNGTVDKAREFVFGGNGQTDLEALHAQYGAQLDANDADFTQFAVWNDANSNGVVDANELQSLAEAGITSIGLVSDGIAYSAANGDVQVAGTSSFTRADGSTGDAADALFSTRAAKATAGHRARRRQQQLRRSRGGGGCGRRRVNSAAASVPTVQDASRHIVKMPLVRKSWRRSRQQRAQAATAIGLQRAAQRRVRVRCADDGDHVAHGDRSEPHRRAGHCGPVDRQRSGRIARATDFSAMVQMPAPSTGMKVAMAAVAESLVPDQAGVSAQANGVGRTDHRRCAARRRRMARTSTRC